MDVAFLFNSDYPAYKKGANYIWPARRLIFRSGILQASSRHMKMGYGDVIIKGDHSERARIRELVFFDHRWSMIHESRLRAVFDRAVIFAIVFQNMTKSIAVQLHKRLSRSGGYLGMKGVDFSYPPHLVVFRNFIGSQYRIKGTKICIFYSMGSNEDEDPYDLEEIRKLGFSDVGYEDQGLRGTIFDDFDKPAHFQQIARLREELAKHLAGGEEESSQIVLEFEDLNPQLFHALGAAIDAVIKAEHEEHIAQAALSGRRYIERLADTLFPPRETRHKGRDIGPDKYKNRLWAFIADNLPQGDPRIQTLGREAERLVKELNGGLHGDKHADHILKALVDATNFTMKLLTLNPDSAQQIHAPYMPGFKRFLDDVIKDRSVKKPNRRK